VIGDGVRGEEGERSSAAAVRGAGVSVSRDHVGGERGGDRGGPVRAFGSSGNAPAARRPPRRATARGPPFSRFREPGCDGEQEQDELVLPEEVLDSDDDGTAAGLVGGPRRQGEGQPFLALRRGGPGLPRTAQRRGRLAEEDGDAERGDGGGHAEPPGERQGPRQVPGGHVRAAPVAVAGRRRS
jgi:hypothetical protein